MSKGNAKNKDGGWENSEICKNTTVPGDMRKSSGTNYTVDRITTPVEK